MLGRSAWWYHHEYRPPICPLCFAGEGEFIEADDPDRPSDVSRTVDCFRCEDPDCAHVWCEEEY